MHRPHSHPLLHEISECPACGSDAVSLPTYPGDYCDCETCGHSWPTSEEQTAKMWRKNGWLQGKPAVEIGTTFLATVPGSGTEYRCTPDGNDIVFTDGSGARRLPDDQFWFQFQFLRTVENSRP